MENSKTQKSTEHILNTKTMANKANNMLEHFCQYFCDFHKKDILSHIECLKCNQSHQEFPTYISCSHIRSKFNPKNNVILPKNFELEFDSFVKRDSSKRDSDKRDSGGGEYVKPKPFTFEGKKILIERTGGGLGDLLTITVAVKELKRKFPSACIIFKVSPQYKPVLEHNPYIDSIIDLDKNIEKDIFISYSSPCPAGVYESSHNRNIFKSRIDIFSEYLGLFPIDKKPVFCLTDEEKNQALKFFEEHNVLAQKKVGIAMAAAEIWKSWTREGNIKLINLLIEKGYIPVVFTTKSQEPVNVKGTINIHDEPIRKVASILKYCDIVITQDGGMLHLVAALEVPQICLLGPTDPKYRVGMYRGGYWIVRHKGICPLKYNNNKFCWYYSECTVDKDHKNGRADIVPPCLKAIRAEHVLKKIERILNVF